MLALTFLYFILQGHLVFCVVEHNFLQPSEIIKIHDERVVGIATLNGTNFFLGGLFPIHMAVVGSGGGVCGSEFTEPGLELMEAMLLSIDMINSDSNLLPNIILGYDIHDTCSSENIGLDESVAWATANIAEEEICTATGSQPAATYDQVSQMVAVIGTYYSRVSVPVASLFRLFEVPQVSYGATSPLLSNRDRYKYFLRTTPPDNRQAQAMVDLLLEFGWTVVSTVHSTDVYGQYGIDAFRNFITDNNIDVCIDLSEGIADDFVDSDYAKIADHLVHTSTSDVVVLFALEYQALKLLEQISFIGTTRRFSWIGSDAWTESTQILDDYGDLIHGMFGFVPFAAPYTPFESYLEQLTPSNNLRDPWYANYTQSFFARNMEQYQPNSSVTDSSLYMQPTFLPFVIDSVYAAATGLHNFLTDVCGSPINWDSTTNSCNGKGVALNGSTMLKYIQNVNFTSPTGLHVMFDSNGNSVEGIYSILNIQNFPGEGYKIIQVGKWSSSTEEITFEVALEDIQFAETQNGEVVESGCTMCPLGYIQSEIPTSCCVHCDPCTGKTYANSTPAYVCEECPLYTWGNDPLNANNHCQSLAEDYFKYSDALGIVLLIVGSLGLVLILTVAVVTRVWLWENPVIKSFGREQMVLIFIGVGSCFVLPIAYVFRPSVAACLFQQLGLWFSLSLILGALLVKLVRITRIFLGVKVGQRQRFIEPKYQILFTFIVVAVQMVLVVISLAVSPPKAVYSEEYNSTNSFNFPQLIVTCNPPKAAALTFLILYDSFLVILINGFAVFTIRFPENFNESRHIAFATFAIGIVWLAFMPLYFNTSSKSQQAVVAFAIIIVGVCILVCLFVPRYYRVFQNHKIKKNVSSVPSSGLTQPTSASFSLGIDKSITTVESNS